MRSNQNATLKRRRIWAVLAVGLAVSILLVVIAKPAQSTVRPAKRADAFVNSIGVDTHLRYRQTPYHNKYPLIKNKLSALGVRHVRDAAFISSDSKYNELVYGRYKELAALGIRFTLNVDPRRSGLETVDQATIAKVAEMAGPSLESFEGPNEYNKSGDDNWVKNLRTYQQSLYRAVKGNKSTSSVSVLGPALGKPYPSVKPDLENYLDYGSFHPYPGGNKPYNWGFDNYNLPAARAVSGTKPLIATETGYHTTNSGASTSVSEKAMGKYLPRLFLEYFNRNITRTHTYELIDQKPDLDGTDREANFGLLRNNGTEKPAYKSLKNLIALLEDPGPKFKPGSLEYALSGETKGVHRTLLQKRDGRFYLVLWQETDSYNLDTKRDLSVSRKRVTLSLNQPIRRASTYLPGNSASPLRSYRAPKRLTLSVPDHPLVVELVPSSKSVSRPTNTAPKVVNVRPRPGNRVKSRRPVIRATVRDRETNLRKSNIVLFVDGNKKRRFAYNRSTDRLRYRPRGRLALGRYHVVKIIARDPKGLRTVKRWKFKVIRR